MYFASKLLSVFLFQLQKTVVTSVSSKKKSKEDKVKALKQKMAENKNKLSPEMRLKGNRQIGKEMKLMKKKQKKEKKKSGEWKKNSGGLYQRLCSRVVSFNSRH